MGRAAVLVETTDVEAALALRRAVASAVASGSPTWEWVEETVVGARTLLVRLRDPATAEALDRVRQACAALLTAAVDAASDGEWLDEQPDDTEAVEIIVRYDGPDLDEVADLTGLTPEEVVAAHTSTPWRVAFGGFAPGFAYLVGGDPRLRVPRRREPRPTVPAGSVALAGDYSGVYPQASPGGWQLIGTTEAALWRTDREPPALLRPGAVVRFVAADARAARASHPAVTSGRATSAGLRESPADPSRVAAVAAVAAVAVGRSRCSPPGP